jgi:hypothetical protein
VLITRNTHRKTQEVGQPPLPPKEPVFSLGLGATGTLPALYMKLPNGEVWQFCSHPDALKTFGTEWHGKNIRPGSDMQAEYRRRYETMLGSNGMKAV